MFLLELVSLIWIPIAQCNGWRKKHQLHIEWFLYCEITLYCKNKNPIDGVGKEFE